MTEKIDVTKQYKKKVEELKITNWLLNKESESQRLIPKQKGFKQGSEEKVFNSQKYLIIYL